MQLNVLINFEYLLKYDIETRKREHAYLPVLQTSNGYNETSEILILFIFMLIEEICNTQETTLIQNTTIQKNSTFPQQDIAIQLLIV